MSKANDIDELLDEADELLEDDDDRHNDARRADDRADDGQHQVEVIENDESYIQSQRLRDIFDARQAVREQRLKMKIHSIESEQTTDRRNAKRVYRAAIENYLSELRPLFMEDEQGKNVWFNMDFGTLEINLPVQTKTVRRGQTKRVHETVKDGEKTELPVNNIPEPKEIELNGLNYLFDLPEPITANFSWVATTNGMGGGTSRYHATITHDIGFDKLDAVMNEANDRLRKRGLDLELGEEDDDEWELSHG
jgi:hypothetical protein